MVLFGLFWVVVVILVRLVLSFSIGGAGPYSLIYPAILISTLFGRWQAGLICFVLSFLYSWYYILPYPGSSPASGFLPLSGKSALFLHVFSVHSGTRKERKEECP